MHTAWMVEPPTHTAKRNTEGKRDCCLLLHAEVILKDVELPRHLREDEHARALLLQLREQLFVAMAVVVCGRSVDCGYYFIIT